MSLSSLLTFNVVHVFGILLPLTRFEAGWSPSQWAAWDVNPTVTYRFSSIMPGSLINANL